MQDATHSESTDTAKNDEGSPLQDVVDFVEFGIRTQMKERPYVALGAALGLGYVLGGGLPKFAVKAALAYGLRQAASKFFTNAFPGG
jgi:hypothetical protein